MIASIVPWPPFELLLSVESLSGEWQSGSALIGRPEPTCHHGRGVTISEVSAELWFHRRPRVASIV
jgi:hypothetical protein